MQVKEKGAENTTQGYEIETEQVVGTVLKLLNTLKYNYYLLI